MQNQTQILPAQVFKRMKIQQHIQVLKQIQILERTIANPKAESTNLAAEAQTDWVKFVFGVQINKVPSQAARSENRSTERRMSKINTGRQSRLQLFTFITSSFINS